MEACFIHNPDGPDRHAHAASLFQASNGTLYATWFTYPGPKDYEHGKIALSRMDSRTGKWEKAKFIFPNIKSSAGNPILFEDPKTGDLRILFFLINGSYFTDSNVYESKSTDGGKTWASPSCIFSSQGAMVRHSPITLDDDTLLLPAYDDRRKVSEIYRQRPTSNTWELVHTFDEGPIQPDFARTASGAICVFFRATGEHRIVRRARSGDEGRTWSATIQTQVPCPLSGIASFSINGEIGLVFNNTKEQKRTPLSIATSTNSGVSWSPAWDIDKSPHEVSYPHFIVDRNNLIHGVYTYNRRMIKYVTFTFDELKNGTK